jgi:hypothetical protein
LKGKESKKRKKRLEGRLMIQVNQCFQKSKTKKQKEIFLLQIKTKDL